MQFENLKNEGLEKHFKISLPINELQEKIKAELEKIAKTHKIPGFRPGKVPFSIIQKKFESAVQEEVVKQEILNARRKLESDLKIKYASEPQITNIDEFNSALTNNKAFNFDLKFEVLPEIKIPDFKKIKIQKLVPNIKDKDIEEETQKLLEHSKEFVKADAKSKVQQKDLVVMSFEGTKDGKPFQGGKAENYSLEIGSKKFIEDFEKQLIGFKIGEEKTIDVKFPESYPVKDLAGEVVQFKVKVHEIKKPKIPELNEEFLKKLKFKSKEELDKKISDQIQDFYASQVRVLMKISLFDELEKLLSFDLPKSLVEREFNSLWEQVTKIQEHDPNYKKDKKEKELKDYYYKVAARRVKVGLLLSEYAKIKDIKATNSDLQKAVIDQARMYPGNEASIFEFYKQNPQALQPLIGMIVEEKAVDAIFAGEVAIEDKKTDITKLKKLLEDTNSDAA